ncbi:hypothetical protein PYCC9005_005815 [Savitreella phatthalungensis]
MEQRPVFRGRESEREGGVTQMPASEDGRHGVASAMGGGEEAGGLEDGGLGDLTRCWICFEEESGVDPMRSEGWRKPCACSLVAHEACLLRWVDETQRHSPQGPIPTSSIRCPQCKQRYAITSRRSHLVRALTVGDKWITRGLLATIPLGMLKGFAVACFYYGQAAMQDVLGEDRLMEIIVNLKPGDEARYMIGASVIPFCLIGSRFDLFNFVLPLVPSIFCFSDASFIQARRPMQSSPTLWLCVLPWLRNVYSVCWRVCFGRRELQWKREAGLLRERSRELAPGVVLRDRPIDRIQAGDAPPMLELNVAERRRARHEQLIQEHAEGGPHNHNDNNNNNDEDGEAERWIYIEAPKFARLIAGALVLPKLASWSGTLLSRAIPSFRKAYPHRFQRALIGGVCFVVAKDFLNLFYLYARAKGRATRHIQNRILTR